MDTWETTPDVSDTKSHYSGTGAAAVTNPFLANQSTAPPAAASPSAPIRRANSFGRFGGGGEKCYACGKTVYAAEMRTVEKRKFHKDCFRCKKDGCSKLLTQDYCIESTSGDAYCKPHFMQLKRPAMGSLVTSRASPAPSTSDPIPASAPVLSSSSLPAPAPTPAAATSALAASAPAPVPAAAPSAAAASIAARFGGGGEKCHSCKKTVYAAERATAQGKVYHKDCMR